MAKPTVAQPITPIVPIEPHRTRSKRSRKTAVPPADTASNPTEVVMAQFGTAEETPPATEPLHSPQKTATRSKATSNRSKSAKTQHQAILRDALSVSTDWEVPRQRLAQQIQQLEQTVQRLQTQLQSMNQQSDLICSRSTHVSSTLNELRQLSDQVRHAPKSLEMPSFMKTSHRLADWSQAAAAEPAPYPHQTIAPAIQVDQISQGRGATSSRSSTPMPQTNRPALPPFEPVQHRGVRRARGMELSSSSSLSAPRRRRQRRASWLHLGKVTFLRLLDRVLPLPTDPISKIVDAIAWVLATIGVRLALQFLLIALPWFAYPLNALMTIPAVVAAYLAFCVPTSRSDVIYRLLLITLGLLIGSRL